MSKAMRRTSLPIPTMSASTRTCQRSLGVLPCHRAWRLTPRRRSQLHGVVAPEFALNLDYNSGLVPHVENKLAIGRAVVDAETGGDGRERTFPAALGR